MISASQQQRIADGLCYWCGQPRGSDGTPRLCRTHANIQARYIKELRKKRKADGDCIICGDPNETKFVSCEHCRTIHNANEKRLNAQNKRYIRTYGITFAEVQSLIAQQQGLCAICPTLLGGRDVCIDHDHVIGAIRGVLCQPCNRGLGHFKDNLSLLESAVRYLRQHEQAQAVRNYSAKKV